jgi:hypothetical protein
MKNILTIAFCVGIAFTGTAQKGLKIEVNKSSGDTTYSTSEQKIYVKAGSKNAAAEMLKTTIYKTGRRYLLSFYVQTGRTSVFSISQGDEAEITLEDGSKVVLSCIGDRESRSMISYYGSYLFPTYNLDKNSTDALSSSPISSIRIRASMGWMNYTLKPRDADKVMEQLKKFQGL